MQRRLLLAVALLSSITPILCNGLQLNTPYRKPQDNPGVLSGTVHNNRNVPLKDVRVELAPVEGVTGSTVSTYSAPDGSFSFSNLSYGQYVLTASVGVLDTSQDIVVHSSQDWVSVAIDLDVASKDATVSVDELQVPSKASKAFEKATVAVRHNKLEDADRYLAKALLVWPHYCRALTLRASLALTRNSLDQARADAEKAVEYGPNDSTAYMVLGESYLALNRMGDALHAIDRSIDIMPNAWQPYYEKGKILLSNRDWAGTLREATKAASLMTEDDPYLHLLKAFAFAGMKDGRAAKNEVDSFRRLKPESSWSSQTKRQIDAIDLYATRSNPTSPY